MQRMYAGTRSAPTQRQELLRIPAVTNELPSDENPLVGKAGGEETIPDGERQRSPGIV